MSKVTFYFTRKTVLSKKIFTAFWLFPFMPTNIFETCTQFQLTFDLVPFTKHKHVLFATVFVSFSMPIVFHSLGADAEVIQIISISESKFIKSCLLKIFWIILVIIKHRHDCTSWIVRLKRRKTYIFQWNIELKFITPSSQVGNLVLQRQHLHRSKCSRYTLYYW